MAPRAFSQADRFLSELESRKLRPAYVLAGDEAFFRKRCRDAILDHLVSPDARDFSIFEFDLSDTSLSEVLDRARTPSLMVPFQVFFVRGVKTLFGRGSNDEKITAIEDFAERRFAQVEFEDAEIARIGCDQMLKDGIAAALAEKGLVAHQHISRLELARLELAEEAVGLAEGARRH